MSMFTFVPRERTQSQRLVAVGCGGAGSNVIRALVEGRVEGAELVCLNTDAQHLDRIGADFEGNVLSPSRVLLDPESTRGQGAGGDPVVGRRAAEAMAEEIRSIVEGADLVFVALGEGGGTGTGSGPVVAQIAKECGALVVAMVTTPFGTEGPRRRRRAAEGLAELEQHVDALLVVPNDRLLAAAGDQTLAEAMRYGASVLAMGVRAISEIANVAGLVNMDFADVRAVLKDSGRSLIGMGAGNDPAEVAVMATSSNLLEGCVIDGASGVLLNIRHTQDVTLREIHALVEHVQAALDEDAEVMFGTTVVTPVDGEATPRIELTVIAAGIGGRRKPVESGSAASSVPQRTAAPQRAAAPASSASANAYVPNAYTAVPAQAASAAVHQAAPAPSYGSQAAPAYSNAQPAAARPQGFQAMAPAATRSYEAQYAPSEMDVPVGHRVQRDLSPQRMDDVFRDEDVPFVTAPRRYNGN